MRFGESVSENEARVMNVGRETSTYSFKLPQSIRTHARQIDEKLANIKICDPAIGSGAFPVGMMSEIVRARQTLSSYLDAPDRTPYNFKRDCIQHALYGVDIDPGAVEIAKLRLTRWSWMKTTSGRSSRCPTWIIKSCAAIPY